MGSILAAVTPNAAVLLIARTLIGLAIGADSAIATAYIAEYGPSGRRGALSMLQQWMITAGMLETKGHSVEEITRIFDREAEKGITASAAADAA